MALIGDKTGTECYLGKVGGKVLIVNTSAEMTFAWTSPELGGGPELVYAELIGETLEDGQFRELTIPETNSLLASWLGDVGYPDDE